MAGQCSRLTFYILVLTNRGLDTYEDLAAHIPATTDLDSRAAETEIALSQLLSEGYDDTIQNLAEHHLLSRLSPLHPGRCPEYHEDERGIGRKGSRVAVAAGDPLDIAIQLCRAWDTAPGGRLPERSDAVLVMNEAERKNPGDEWRSGALGTEEELCYRTSLSLTYDNDEYERNGLPIAGGDYASKVVIIRQSVSHGHAYYDRQELDHVAVVSVCALERPDVTRQVDKYDTYARRSDCSTLMEKWRFILRLAASKRHRRLVLSLVGCGKQKNPPRDVAKIFKQVASEPEFCGGWFEKVIFAISPLTESRDEILQAARSELDGFVF